jgi:predicted acyltransferase
MVKVPVVSKPEYIMYLEYANNLNWFHTDVTYWSADIKKQYIKDLNVLQRLSRCYFYALIEETNTKLQKFARVIGFKQEQPMLGLDNKMYTIFSRSL